MPIQIQAPDGSLVEFPDDTPDDIMTKAMRETFGGPEATAPDAVKPAATPIATAPPAQPAPPVEPSWTDTIMNGASYAGGLLDQAGRGIAQGATNVVGIPSAIQDVGFGVLDYGLGKAGAPQGVRDAVSTYKNLTDFFPSSQSMQGGLDAANNATADVLGVERPRGKPENMGERFVNRVGQEVGAMAVPVAGTAIRAATMTPAEALAGNWFDRAFTAPAAINPSRFAAQEVGSAVAAGTGAAGVNEATNAAGYGPETKTGMIGDLIGSLGGAGLYGIAKAVRSAGSDVMAAYGGDPAAASRTVRDNVADTLLSNSDVVRQGINASDNPVIDSTELATTILRPTRAEAVIPGFQASTADRAGDAGLAALENARSKGVNVGRFRARQNANTDAVEGTIGALAPDATPGVYREAADLERERRIAAAASEADIARAAFDDASASAQPVLREGAARGSSLRGALQDARDRVAANVDELYAPINTSDTRVDIAPLRDRFAGTVQDLPLNDRQRFLPAEARVPEQLAPPVGEQPPVQTGLLDASGNPITRPAPVPDTTVPLSEVTSVRSGLTDDIRAANATPGKAQQARVANQFRQQTDEYMDAILPPELRTQMDAARAGRRDMADRFERPGTGIAETLKPREGGGYALDDSAVTPRFTPTDQGKVADFQSLMREAGTDQRARRAIEDELITQVQGNKLTDKPEQLRKFLGDRNVVLSEFPELKSKLENLGVTRETLDNATRAAETTRRDLTTPGRSNVATYLQYGDAQSEKAISGVLSSADPAKAADELASFVGNDPRALEGLKASFWQKMDSSARSRNVLSETDNGTRPIVPQRLIKFLDDPKVAAVAERIYSDNPEHLGNLRQIGEALRGVNLEQRVGKSINPSGTAQALRGSPSVTAAEVQSKLYQAQSGRVSKAYVVLYLAQKVARGAVSKQSTRAYERLLDEALLNPRIASGLLMENNPANRAALARSAKGWLGNEAATFTNLLNSSDEDEDKRAIMDER